MTAPEDSGSQEQLPDLALFNSTLSSLSSSCQSTTSLLSNLSPSSHSYSNGISLLSLKNDLLLSYIHHLTLLTLARLHGRDVNSDSGDDNMLVKGLVRQRIMLEKMGPLEMKLRYQVDKLCKLAEGAESKEGAGEENDDGAIDPLAFRPNLAALSGGKGEASEGSGGGEDSSDEDDLRGGKNGRATDGIYRPPRLAPVAYTEENRKGKKARPAPSNPLLRDLATSLTNSTSNPYAEGTSGLGSTPTLSSRKSQKLADITRYEEENFTRLFLNKKDAKRRRMDEEDIALGGSGSREDYMVGSKGVRGKREYGFENEFDDLLGVIGKKRKTGAQDGYDALRAMRRERKPLGEGDAELTNVNGMPAEAGRNKGRAGKGKFKKAVKRSVQAGGKKKRRG